MNDNSHIEFIEKQVVDISYNIHKQLGPGLLESIYKRCFVYELSKRQIPFQAQMKVPIFCNNIEFSEGLRLDLLVDNLVIDEIKAQENYPPVWEAQLLSYLKLSNKQLGYIVNFTVPLIKNGIKRMVL